MTNGYVYNCSTNSIQYPLVNFIKKTEAINKLIQIDDDSVLSEKDGVYIFHSCDLQIIRNVLTKMLKKHDHIILITDATNSMIRYMKKCNVLLDTDTPNYQMKQYLVYSLFGKHYRIQYSSEYDIIKLIPKTQEISDNEYHHLIYEIAYCIIVKGCNENREVYDILHNYKLFPYDYSVFLLYFENVVGRILEIHNTIEKMEQDMNVIKTHFDYSILEEQDWIQLYSEYYNTLNSYHSLLLEKYPSSTPTLSIPSTTPSTDTSIISVELSSDEEPIDYVVPYFQMKKSIGLVSENKGLENILGFSCFIDSVLLPMLYIPIPYFTTNIYNKSPETISDKHKLEFTDIQKYNDIYIKIRNELKTLETNIQNNNVEQCSGLIHLFGSINQTYKDFINQAILKKGGDDAEFLDMFMNFFDLKPTKVFVEEYLIDETDEVSFLSQTYEYVSIYYSLEKLVYIENPVITQLPNKNGKERYRKYTIVESDCLVIKTNTIQEDMFKYLNIQQSRYKLSVITLYKNGHYIALFEKDGLWYIFNDLKPSIEKIKLSDYKQTIIDHASLVIYTKMI